jgi:uncharacterized protein YdiU (UPF0061 family)
MLREYLISEAMHGFGIATTRSLAVVATGEPVYREEILDGAVLTRVAASHLRVGTFEFAAAREDVEGLKALTAYAIDRHYPELKVSDNPALALLDAVIVRQAELIAEWMRVGFVHGVMNTDNMTISGETIDYGPCASATPSPTSRRLPNGIWQGLQSHSSRFSMRTKNGLSHWRQSALGVSGRFMRIAICR